MKQIQIGGITPFTTIDYPGKLAAVLFFYGCPIRCAYCSNPHLFESGGDEYDPDKVLEWLRDRQGKLDAVVFSGGEALMQGDTAIDYIKRVRDMDFKIGLHTNGFYPEVFERALPFIDWTGIDFKTTKEQYPTLVGSTVAYDRMIQSLDIWIASKKDGEVRITCDPRFVTKESLVEIANLLSGRGVKTVAIQKYIPHFEPEDNKTTPEARSQFFNDNGLRATLNSLLESVYWRE
ncbi:MAG: anaerobic ribonucleoside-triphosphate reductase activating protein [Rickettsiales bacterium]|jgi:pyruvate formate lyase activating enzyme|nr:anaerobic ribonucleoside-triphosphate reductase activating protein [Rickettsiales bacterium]